MNKKWNKELMLLATATSIFSAPLLHAEGPWLSTGLQGQNIWALEVGPSGYILAGTAILDPRTMYRSTDFGVTWSESSGLPSGTEIWDIEIDPTDDSIVYAGLNGAGVYKSLDGGATWTWSNLGGQIWHIDVAPTNPDVLYVASQTGGIYKSVDAGDTWQVQDLGGVDNATAVAVHPADPDVAFAGTPFGGVFKTTDGGLNWFAVNTGFELAPGIIADIRSFLVDPTNPTTVYAGEFWNGVFKSDDGGNTWYKPDPNLLATVSAIETIGGDIYAINTFDDDGHPVYRSRDGGSTWQPLVGHSGNLWPRSLELVPGAVLIGTELTPNLGGIYAWPLDDADLDGLLDDVDNCPSTPNAAQSDVDGDTVGDLCDPCPGDATSSCVPGGSAAAEVSASQGGSLTTQNGAVTLDIDSGDLAEDTTLSITELPPGAAGADLILDDGIGSGLPLANYRFEPDGIGFNSSVTLTITADVSGLNRGQRQHLGLYVFTDTDGDGVEDSHLPLDSTCAIVEDPADTFMATCTAELAHLSLYSMIAPVDSDDDEVPDLFGAIADACAATRVPESVPTEYLKSNRFALVDADPVFDTADPPGNRQPFSYSLIDTAGCSCEQIISVLGLGAGQTRFGCSNSVMDEWIASPEN